MTLKALRPMLWTQELEKTIAFYTSLGFAVGSRNDEWGWAALQRDEVEIMISRPTEHTPFDKPGFTGSFYIISDDVDTLWKQWRDKVKVAYPLEEFEWGMREFAIYDNNGYLLQFGQDVSVEAKQTIGK